MNNEELQTARDFILRAAGRMPRGISQSTLEISLPSVGIQLPESGSDSLDAQIGYLIGAGLLQAKRPRHTPSLILYTLTPAGEDYLRSANLL